MSGDFDRFDEWPDGVQHIDIDSLIRELVACKRRIDRLEIALHRIAGHGNVAADKAREIAAEALSEKT